MMKTKIGFAIAVAVMNQALATADEFRPVGAASLSGQEFSVFGYEDGDSRYVANERAWKLAHADARQKCRFRPYDIKPETMKSSCTHWKQHGFWTCYADAVVRCR